MQGVNRPEASHISRERNPEAFPILRDEQVQVIAEVGERRLFADGADVWKIGLPMTSFFVVVHGAVEVFQISGTGEEHHVVVHQPGEFTGDIDMITGRSALVTATARGATRVIAISAENIRRVVAEAPDLGNIVLRGFMMRRTLLLDAGFSGLRIIGSRFSPDTVQLTQFAGRNGRRHCYPDEAGRPVLCAARSARQLGCRGRALRVSALPQRR